MSSDMKELKNEEKDNNNNTVMALVFIAVGVVLVASNVVGFEFQNWWALFLLIPISQFAKSIYDDYQENGTVTARSTGAIITTLAISAAAVIFLVDAITWGMVWPIGLIFAGIAIYFGNRS